MHKKEGMTSMASENGNWVTINGILQMYDSFYLKYSQ